MFEQSPALASLATLGEFALPVAAAAVVFGTLARQWRRRRLVRGVTLSRGLAMIEGKTWYDFEMLVGEAFRLQGYEVQERGSGNGEIVAFELRRGDELYLVECKHWRKDTVGVATVREFYGVMTRSGAAGGFLITSGRYNDDAIAYAQDTHLELIDGDALVQLLHEAKSRGRR